MSSSVFRLLEEAVQARGSEIALSHPKKGGFCDMLWSEVHHKVLSVAAGLHSLSIEPGERVAIMSKTRIEWTLVDLGTLALSACTVPLYHSINDDDFFFILKDSGASVVFLEDSKMLSRLRKFRDKLPMLRHVVVIETGGKLDATKGELSFSQLMTSGSKKEIARVVEERVEATKPDDLASIVYTSGTTGSPKGAMITHDNFLYEAHAIEKLGIISSSEVQLIFLPLAHIFARVLQFAWLKTKHKMAFAQDFEHLSEDIQTVRPTVLAGVPRVFEKIHAQIVSKGTSAPGFKKRLVKWAFEKAEDKRKLEVAGKEDSSLSWAISEALVFSKIKLELERKFGGRLRFLISGGAALSPEITYFFKYAGITIIEGWGLTETTAATCLNVPASNKIGTVGKPLPGTQVKTAADQEILVKGRGVFKGYWNNERATKESFDADGYFITGDVGVIQSGEFLKITDRKKDIIVTAGGKKVAPQKLEGIYKSANSLISQAVVLGDERPFVTALFTLEDQALKNFAAKMGIDADYSSLTKNAVVYEKLRSDVEAVNQSLASFEQVKKFAILDHDFEVGNQLTPTLKVRRRYCAKKYSQIVDKLYTARGSS